VASLFGRDRSYQSDGTNLKLDFSTNRTPFLCQNKLTRTQVWSGKVLRTAVNLMGQPYVGCQQRTERHFMSKQGPPHPARGNTVHLEKCVALPILFFVGTLAAVYANYFLSESGSLLCPWLTLMGSIKRPKNKPQDSWLMCCHQDTGTTAAEFERFNFDEWCVNLILI
jgi:hypothetical protein